MLQKRLYLKKNSENKQFSLFVRRWILVDFSTKFNIPELKGCFDKIFIKFINISKKKDFVTWDFA